MIDEQFFHYSDKRNQYILRKISYRKGAEIRDVAEGGGKTFLKSSNG